MQSTVYFVQLEGAIWILISLALSWLSVKFYDVCNCKSDLSEEEKLQAILYSVVLAFIAVLILGNNLAQVFIPEGYIEVLKIR